MSKGLVVVVEDSKTVRQFYKELLEESGFTVLAVRTGEEGLRLLYVHMPRVVILDIDLPGINGIEVCRRLRKTMGWSVPVIFCTSNDTLDTLKACIEAGGDDFVIKQGNADQTLERVCYWAKARDRSLRADQRKAALGQIGELEKSKSDAGAGEDAPFDIAGAPPQENDDTKRIIAYVSEACADVRPLLKRSAQGRLMLLGFAAGVLNARARSSLALKVRFVEHLKEVLHRCDLLAANETEITLSNWDALYNSVPFQLASECGEADADVWLRTGAGGSSFRQLASDHLRDAGQAAPVREAARP